MPKTIISIRLPAQDLIFISRIERDGSGTVKVDEYRQKYLEGLNEDYTIACLSISKDTYLANGFNSYVVKIKESGKKKLNDYYNK